MISRLGWFLLVGSIVSALSFVFFINSSLLVTGLESHTSGEVIYTPPGWANFFWNGLVADMYRQNITSFLSNLLVSILLFWNIIFFKNSKRAFMWALIIPYILFFFYTIYKITTYSDSDNADLYLVYLPPVFLPRILIGNIIQFFMRKLLLANYSIAIYFIAIIIWISLSIHAYLDISWLLG